MAEVDQNQHAIDEKEHLIGSSPTVDEVDNYKISLKIVMCHQKQVNYDQNQQMLIIIHWDHHMSKEIVNHQCKVQIEID